MARHHKIGLDSNILIAIVEANPHYGEQARIVFNRFQHYGNQIWISAITIPEVLIKPIEKRAKKILTDYENLLFSGAFLYAPITLATARQAAYIGGASHLHAADSLILASFLESGVTGFVTADKGFQSVNDMEILLITE